MLIFQRILPGEIGYIHRILLSVSIYRPAILLPPPLWDADVPYCSLQIRRQDPYIAYRLHRINKYLLHVQFRVILERKMFEPY